LDRTEKERGDVSSRYKIDLSCWLCIWKCNSAVLMLVDCAV
jgi:hypothetical protein